MIYAYDFEATTGAIENRRPFVHISPQEGIPDGLTVDSEGYVWSALWGGWKVVRYDPAGKVEREIRTPVQNPTSCAFGGEQMDELYITSARLNLSEEQRKEQTLAGDLFRIKTETRGIEEPRFLG
jgi:sugar lactone lactonase YvrE